MRPRNNSHCCWGCEFSRLSSTLTTAVIPISHIWPNQQAQSARR